MIGLWPSWPVRVGSTGARSIFISDRKRRVRPLRGSASHEVFVPFSVCGLRCALSHEAASLGLSHFDVRSSACLLHYRASAIAGGFGNSADRSRCRGSILVLVVFAGSAFCALRALPCAARAADITVHAGPTGSCVAVSLRRDVPLPVFRRTLSQPGRTPAISLLARGWCGNALGIFAPFAVFPVCGSRRL